MSLTQPEYLSTSEAAVVLGMSARCQFQLEIAHFFQLKIAHFSEVRTEV